ncbi:DNA polymerase III subunit delta [Candidatus Fukatsuia anoeciicola]|uniref:DNA polymerase III subunit delta n=1 Tax=Candidatus Fukatsuia anoeciicola TaxID=2994492 RepID=UPI0034649745
MIYVSTEQLSMQLQQGLRNCYLLYGNDPLLLQESQDAIYHAAKHQGFNEYFSIILDSYTEWMNIFTLCQARNLFTCRQILLLIFPDSGLTALMSQQLIKLTVLLHPDILLLLRINKLTKIQQNSIWYKLLSKNAVFINCQTPDQTQLPHWVNNRIQNMKLDIDTTAIQLLCYCYEGNLFALSQILQKLSLLYPNKRLTLLHVKQIANDVARFTPYHWLDALLIGEKERTWHILQRLQQEEEHPVILLRVLQPNLLLLLTLKCNMEQIQLYSLFKQHKVWQNRRNIIMKALQRLSLFQIQQAIHLLAQIEIELKNNYCQSIWLRLETLSMLLCGIELPESLLNVY